MSTKDDKVDFEDVTLESLGCHLIFGEIDEDITKDAITFLLKANHLFKKEELTLFVNSVGGDTAAGFALIDLMGASRLPIRTIATGTIMSMGVLLACAGTKGKRIMTRNTEVMAHQYSWGEDSLKFHELVARRSAQDYLAHRFIQHFLRHTTMTEKQIKDVVFGPADRWLTPQECKKYGLVDHLVDELPVLTSPLDAELLPVLQSADQHKPRISKTGPRKKR